MYTAPALLIDNALRIGSGPNLAVIDPGSEEVLAEIRMAGPNDVADALASAERGFAAWCEIGPWSRSDMLRRIGALMRERVAEIAELISLEVGKPIVEAELETISGAEHFEWAADLCRQLHGFSTSSRAPGGRGHVVYEPIGIALALTAWNFPINLSSRKVSMALAAGCSVIVRPAEEAPASVGAMLRCCVDAGVPPGAVTLLLGPPDTVVEPLMAAPQVRKVSFTGSTRVGKLLIAQSADTVKRLTLELGGHAPVIVMDDADVIRAAELAAAAKFRNAGQVCTSPSRFYVHEKVAADFVSGVAGVARRLRLGHGLDRSVTMGPLATSQQRDRTERLVDDARARGAMVVAGGRRPTSPNAGYFFEPTVLTDLDPDSEILCEEPFAPVAPIMPFTDLDECLGRANGLEAGLAAYVFTRSDATASRVSERLQAGVVGVNTCGVAMPEGPFGGIKQSGYGREGGFTAIYDYLNTKFIHRQLL
jgi:succinate-semialdehyde dehydrogenase/glutarate-semialdehyde dehydrogenase